MMNALISNALKTARGHVANAGYTSRVTFLMAVAVNQNGDVCRTWRNVPDPCDEWLELADIPCAFAPKSGKHSETDTGTHTRNSEGFELAVARDISGVITNAMRAVVDGNTYDIDAVLSDNGIATLVKLKAVFA